MSQIKTRIKILSSILLLSALTSTAFAQKALLDMLSSGERKYSLELVETGDSYIVTIKEQSGRGQFDVLYESQAITKVKSDKKFDEYTDGRLKLIDHKNGTANFELDNGKHIVAELNTQ